MLSCNSTATPTETILILEKEGTNEQVDELSIRKLLLSL